MVERIETIKTYFLQNDQNFQDEQIRKLFANFVNSVEKNMKNK
jgi:hypothetical protein